MMFLGRFQLGTYISIWQPCLTLSSVPAMPLDPPRLKIYRASDGNLVYSREMPVIDKDVQVGLFRSDVFLGDEFAAGQHQIEISYSIGAATFITPRTFEVIAGGNTAGQALAMHFLRKPQADYVVYQTEDGSIRHGKNPRVS